MPKIVVSNDDGLDIPDFLRVTHKDMPARMKRWAEYAAKNPPRPFAVDKPTEREVAPETVAFLREMEQREAIKKQRSNARRDNHVPKKLLGHVRWDARNNRWAPNTFIDGQPVVETKGAITGRIVSNKPNFEEVPRQSKKKAVDELGAKVIEHTTTDGAFDAAKLKRFATANGVWDDKYASLNNGLQRMNVVNRLRNKGKKDPKFKVKWS